MPIIELTRGFVAIVSKKDFKELSRFKWSATSGPHPYAVRSLGVEYMHCRILEKKDGFVRDHKNRNRLDNRRSNLRHRTISQNGLNASLAKHNSSGVAGVSFHSPSRKWRARIMVNRKEKAAYFDTKKGAIAARSRMLRKAQ